MSKAPLKFTDTPLQSQQPLGTFRENNPLIGTDPHERVTPSDVASVSVENGVDVIEVTYQLRTNPQDWSRTVDASKVFKLDAQTPEYLMNASRDFFAAVARAIREQVDYDRDVPCNTCTGACCVGWDIRVTQADVDEMTRRGVKNVADLLIHYTNPPSPTGHVGVFKMVPRNNPQTGASEQACINLDKKTGWCGIWDARPDVCRTYDAHRCDRHDEWRDKPTDGKIRLDVIG